jgi:hypothetical protein
VRARAAGFTRRAGRGTRLRSGRVAVRGLDTQDISGTLQGLRGRNMDARLKLWLEATAGMQGRCLLRAMIADVGG